jgi:hypothetical protein
VKKVEMKGGGGREVERGSTALNYNPEFTLNLGRAAYGDFLYGGGY